MMDNYPGYFIGTDGKAHDPNGNPVPLPGDTKSVEDVLSVAEDVVPAAPIPPIEEAVIPVEVEAVPDKPKTKKAK